MKKTIILRKKNDIYLLFRKGRRIQSNFFKLVIRPNTLSYTRFIFVTPKLLDKRSTTRNKFRRRTREWIRKHRYNMLTPTDIAVILKKEAINAPQNKFYEDLEMLFNSITRK